MMKSNQKWLKKIKISAEEIQERISFILSFLLYKNKSMKISNKISEKRVKLVDKSEKVYIIERVEKSSRSVGQGVKTPPFHGGNTGSNPVRTMGVSRLMEIGFKKS